jgi:hypothetical protein
VYELKIYLNDTLVDYPLPNGEILPARTTYTEDEAGKQTLILSASDKDFDRLQRGAEDIKQLFLENYEIDPKNLSYFERSPDGDVRPVDFDNPQGVDAHEKHRGDPLEDKEIKEKIEDAKLPETEREQKLVMPKIDIKKDRDYEPEQ